MSDLLQQAVASGQVSAKQIEQHRAAGQLVGKTVLAMSELPVPNVRFTERCGHAVYTAEQMQAAIELLRSELEAKFEAALRTELATAVQGEAVAIPDGLIACLRGGRQCDMDGSEIIMSRQACCEAADILESIDTDKLRQIIAATYQIAGALDAPEHVLDVLANPELATQAQIDALLPFVPAKTVGREVTDALTNAEIMAIADSTKTAEPGKDGYILPISFARAIIAATSTKPAQPLKDAKDSITAKIDEMREILDETYNFATTSPRAQQNINAVSSLLEDIATMAQPAQPLKDAKDAELLDFIDADSGTIRTDILDGLIPRYVYWGNGKTMREAITEAIASQKGDI